MNVNIFFFKTVFLENIFDFTDFYVFIVFSNDKNDENRK